MNTTTLRHLLAWITVFIAIAPATGDTITMKSGDAIRGTVRQFRATHHKTPSSVFIVEVDGQEQTVPLNTIETITFDSRGASPNSAPKRSPTRASLGESSTTGDTDKQEGKSHWLTTSSRKRHNSNCRYFKSSNGRPCGPDEGVPCKLCGG